MFRKREPLNLVLSLCSTRHFSVSTSLDAMPYWIVPFSFVRFLPFAFSRVAGLFCLSRSAPIYEKRTMFEIVVNFEKHSIFVSPTTRTGISLRLSAKGKQLNGLMGDMVMPFRIATNIRSYEHAYTHTNVN